MPARLLAAALLTPDLRPKHLARPVPPAPPSSPGDNVVQLRSPIKKAGRLRSRELLRQAFSECRALVIDFAEATDVDQRAASRAMTGEKPIDIGDLICLASTGPGGTKLARRLLTLLRDELDRIESSHT